MAPTLNDRSTRLRRARVHDPAIVPEKIIRDYTEATAVAELSPRATMILARRCLESIVYDFYGGKGNTLHAALQSIKGQLQNTLFDALMALKGLGNIGAHPGDDVTLDIELDPSDAQQAVTMIEVMLELTYLERERQNQALHNVIGLHGAKMTP